MTVRTALTNCFDRHHSTTFDRWACGWRKSKCFFKLNSTCVWHGISYKQICLVLCWL